MEGIGRGGAKSFDAGMPECQDVRMSECQNVRVSECQDAGHDGSEGRRGGDGLPDAVEAGHAAGGRLRASPGGGGPHPPSIACRGARHASRGVWEMMERK